ncbi:MAG: hypothetical protein M0P13_06370 [Fibrobacteraceae bacterium]|nr:hypothetical protein [Fibrobacteraceae bacterium]
MPESTLNKLKNGAMNCASALLVRVDVAAEEARLRSKYEALGRRLLPVLEKDALDTLKSDPEVVELVGAISENKARIRELKKRLE